MVYSNVNTEIGGYKEVLDDLKSLDEMLEEMRMTVYCDPSGVDTLKV